VLKLNLNDSIKVKLTEYGRDIYYHQYDELNGRAGRVLCEASYPKVDENGFTEFQLHHFMNLYGEYMIVGCKNVIEDNNIYVDPNDLIPVLWSDDTEELMDGVKEEK
jgi:hypothetical protein